MRLAAVSLIGLALFLWPFFGAGLPSDTPALALAVACVGLLILLEAGARRLDARRLALLAAIAAIDSALRLAVVVGVGGFSPVFFLILCAGFVFGASYGFLAGSVALLASALATGGVGPWLPYQMFAAGWVGVAAALGGAGSDGRLTPLRLGALCTVGLLTGFGFGALMDIQVWVTVFRGTPNVGWVPGMAPVVAMGHFGGFYLLTSFAYDGFRAVGNVIALLLLGPPVLAGLNRLRERFTFEVVTVG